MRSYTISTGCDRPPGGQDVACRVDIAVVDHAAAADVDEFLAFIAPTFAAR